LIDQPTVIDVLRDSLKLSGGMGFQYMVDVPESTNCSILKCNSPNGGTKACHFTNLETYAHDHYPQMLQKYQPLERVDQYAKLVSFLRWARKSGHVAGIDFSSLAGVSTRSSEFRTPDAVVRPLNLR
jgi:hypothetical protein